MKAHVLQHVSFEGLGSMEAWLCERGADVQFTRLYHSAELPTPRGLDLVIAMGGPMSVNDEREYPWLKQEKEFLGEALRFGIPISACVLARR
jgi:GMP synthase-like glutamine amidotransferase